MAESFLQLDAKEQSEIYRALASQLARSPVVLEKDVWVCWVLQTLFGMPDRLAMAFKGGTSLSKVFGVIARFSEDVDITLDYRGLDGSIDPFALNVSKTCLKKFSEDLKTFVGEYVYEVVTPHFKTALSNEFGERKFRIEITEDGEKFRLYYPTVLDTPGDYVGSSVLLEFGGRNITEPNSDHVIRPDIADYLSTLEFPGPTVSVLSAARTFWEKATLIHVECQRNEFRNSAERLSRHCYDLAMLADSDIGEEALADRALLLDVIKHKKIFYNASYANYDACLIGELRLIPSDNVLTALESNKSSLISLNR